VNIGFLYHFDVKMRQKLTLLTSTFRTNLFSETDTIINCVNFFSMLLTLHHVMIFGK